MPRRARRVSHARDPQIEVQLDELVRAQNEHVESSTDVHGVGPFRVAKTSRDDQWPDWADVQDKPEAFPPVPHAAIHAAGAADPVTPASIGAETPQGAQEKADLAEARAKAYTDAHATDATLHVTAAYRAAMDNAKAPPSATNPFVTEETLNNAMRGSAKPGVARLADLAAIPPDERADKDTRLVEEDGRIYRFDAEATQGDVRPNEGTGFWIAVAAATQNHNNLAGLQGGSATERYHLTQAEHAAVLSHPSQSTGVHGVGSGYYLAKTSRSDQRPAWADIPDKPTAFPPSPHTHAGSDITSPVSDSDKVDGLHVSDLDGRYVRSSGGALSGTFDLTAATLVWQRDTDSAALYMGDYGSNADWLTIRYGDDPGVDRLRFRWKGTDGEYDVLDLFNADMEMLRSGSGIILRSPNGTRYKVTVNDNGDLVTTRV